ncbi:VirB4 family type IV secretion system protein [Sphingomonas sp. Leaf10]|uniref:VirB4 family type IV secretion system protein n=1 Tax=Sphingomonas sp. Leaf10 TaxID=1735676 RepID=UPI0006F6299C|nr:VirB4 family type IV secretion system protein [Sphingomonas sp. Leaf10]KQM41312.1 type VI secretion protein [Sphingomonas sp. Leaf10]
MQLLSPIAGKAAASRERSAGSMLPYAAQIDPHTVLLRDGRLMQVLRLDGFLFETADSAEIDYRKELRDAVLRAIGSSRFAVYHHVLRRRVSPELPGAFPDGFSQSVESIWRERQARRALFANDLYLAILRAPETGPRGLGGWLNRRLAKGEARVAERMAEVRALDAARDALVSALSLYGPHLLGSYDTPEGPGSQSLEYLAALYNGERMRVRLPHGDVGEHLPARRVSFGAQTLELSPLGHAGRRFTGIVSIKDYPGQTAAGMLDSLYRLPVEMTVTQSFGFVDRPATLSRLNLTLRRMKAADDEAIGLRDELVEARDAVASGRAGFGTHHLTIAVHGDSPAAVDAAVADVQAGLTDLAMVAVREDVGLEPAFWAQFPGNEAFVARGALVSTRNFASLASWHSFPVGRAAGNHWGPAIALLETTAAGPYHFNFHQGDLGNFTVIGPSGSGKTVVLNFLLAQAQRLAPRVVFFDKDRGAEPFLRAIGGNYDVLRPGRPSGLNPLLLDDTSENRRFLIDWIAQLVGGGRALSTEDAAQIERAVATNMNAAPHLRRLGTFAQLLRGGARPHADDLAARLAPWIGSGEHAWLFDNAADTLGIDARVLGFDMTRLLDDPRTRTPAMMYLFHRVEERLDGTPTIIVVDEGWKALDDDVFVARIRDWEKTIRKRNGIVGFATQSAEDALNSRIASAIVDQAATRIFMSNPRAKAEHYCQGFGLTAHEFEIIRALPDTSRAFLIKHGRDSVVAQLDLSGERDLLTILSGRETTVRALDRVRSRVGDDPLHWVPELLAAVA